ncbi:MAG: hypothetical protein LBU57_01215, partial [Dysgonamonadaceae bacterium]|nr:hypothetical protein [Dysgonamonadaceae bacterium]
GGGGAVALATDAVFVTDECLALAGVAGAKAAASSLLMANRWKSAAEGFVDLADSGGGGGGGGSGSGSGSDSSSSSAGRFEPQTLNEQLAMKQVQSNPLQNATEVPIQMNDARWPHSEGWVKMQSIVTHSDGSKTIIHFVYNKATKIFDDFKFIT